MEIGNADSTARYADMLAALGSEPRLRIVRLLLAAHPDGMVAGDIQAETGISASTLSHHLEKLRHEGLVLMKRERTFLRYTANTAALREVLDFLYAECCSRSQTSGSECCSPPQTISTEDIVVKGKKASNE